MKLKQVSRVVAAAIALVALSSGEAFAQVGFAPTLNVTSVGNSVTIEWTPVITPLGAAPTYEVIAGTTPGGAEIAALTIPAVLFPGGVPRIVVSAPNGSYYLRVRAAAGPIKGDWSNIGHVAVGLEGCVPGAAPTVAVSVNQNVATVNWTPVPGTIGYVVQWSRTPGVTELAEAVGGTSTQRTIPMNGTFYVRVVAVTNGCDIATSNEAPFTIAVTRRHLSQGEIAGILVATRNAFPRAWSLAHTGSSERYDYIILACRALYTASGGTVGCNFRRAAIGDLSMDGLSVENPADGRYYFADVISGAGGCCPSIHYGHPFHGGALLRDPSGQYAPWGFANPFGVAGRYPPLRTAANYGAAGGW
jgi:hypothetical protein